MEGGIGAGASERQNLGDLSTSWGFWRLTPRQMQRHLRQIRCDLQFGGLMIPVILFDDAMVDSVRQKGREWGFRS